MRRRLIVPDVSLIRLGTNLPGCRSAEAEPPAELLALVLHAAAGLRKMTAMWRRVSGRGMVVRMNTDFDPYHRWLGIPPKHQPADYYRLLAIERFEADPEVIADAAERQMAHVRRYALGPHQDVSQRILNELAAAKVCLLNPDRKAEYDRKLGELVAPQDLPVPQVVPPSVSALPRVVVPGGTRSPIPAGGAGRLVRVVTERLRRAIRLGLSRLPRKPRTQMSAVAVVGGAAGGGILLGLLVVLLWSLFSIGGSHEAAQSGRRGPIAREAKPDVPAKPKDEPAKESDAAEKANEPTEVPLPKEEPEKTEPAAEQINAKSLPGVRPMDSQETARVRDQVDSVAEMGRAETSRVQEPFAEPLQEIENSIGMKLKLIRPEEFLMGSPDGDSDAASEEKPQHSVRITKPFYLGVTELTQEQYERVMGQNPSKFEGDPQRPVEMVSWEDAVAFCRKLSEREHDDRTYRLPTEAEWEYACRARSQTKWSFGDDEAALKDHAWFRENSDGTAHPVAQKKPNAFGLCDLHGNVWEWCADWYGPYSAESVDDPTGPTVGSDRVIRGGSWSHHARGCRPPGRSRLTPEFRSDYLGFRVACSSVDTEEITPVRKLPDSFDETGRAQESRLRKSAAELPPEIENLIGMKFKLIAADEFLMGSPEGEAGAGSDEEPQHLVRISKPFYLGVTEVTQQQYERVMGQNPSRFKGDPQRPVEMVSWEDVVAFCRKLSDKEGQTYRLPTEAEWECACRAGSTTKWSFGDNAAGLKDHAWYDENSDRSTHPVAQKEPNAFGLYDMHGNVWEWCADWYASDYYTASPTDDPRGAESGSVRVSRGGGWIYVASFCRSACRDGVGPGLRYSSQGFRLARAVSLASAAR